MATRIRANAKMILTLYGASRHYSSLNMWCFYYSKWSRYAQKCVFHLIP